MTRVYERLFVGSESDCRTSDDETAVVHACKSPCHQSAVGYTGNLPTNHPHYLSLRRGNDLYLNMIDPPIESLFPDELFQAFLPFAAEIWDSPKRLLIHCNEGLSRSPSLALLFLAKHIGAISNDSYEEARRDFYKLYPHYSPGGGIQTYLNANWRKLDGV